MFVCKWNSNSAVHAGIVDNKSKSGKESKVKSEVCIPKETIYIKTHMLKYSSLVF